jgi:hypothetical protein
LAVVAAARRLLVNFVYCPPIGHAVEALHYCHGYHLADPEMHLALALNADTATELASLCPYVDETYEISLDVFDPEVPRTGLKAFAEGWDVVVDDDRGHQPDQRSLFPGLAAYYDEADQRFGATGSVIGTAGESPPAYLAGAPFRLPVSDAARRRAEEILSGAAGRDRWPRIAVLPAGSGPRRWYPTLRSWRLIASALLARSRCSVLPPRQEPDRPAHLERLRGRRVRAAPRLPRLRRRRGPATARPAGAGLPL